MRWKTRSRTETERSRTWKAALAASVGLTALALALPTQARAPEAPSPGIVAPPPVEAVGAPSRVLDKPPRVRRYTQARYPEIARQAGVEGFVVVQATVDRSGRVADAVVVSSDSALLDEAALEAVRQWLFHPAERSGVAVRAVVRAPLEFRLR